MKIKKIFLSLILIIILGIVGYLLFENNNKIEQQDSGKINIVVSNFASYDFIRAIIGENSDIELTYLLGPGKDAHSYDPTAQDLIKIQNADLFVYVGGEMESWSDKILNSIEKDDKMTICIADDVETIEEQEIDGAEKEDEEEEENGTFDEHIWTSPSNAIMMINALEKAVEELDSSNSEKYMENAQKYISQINEVNTEIQKIIDNKVRDRLVFADKMPMQYFINYYNLKVSAAFSGCSTETEPSAGTIAYLENVIKDEEIPVVLYIELNDGRVAKTIADETGATAMQIQTLHNISLDDFNNGETWITLMTRNINVLRKALL